MKRFITLILMISIGLFSFFNTKKSEIQLAEEEGRTALFMDTKNGRAVVVWYDKNKKVIKALKFKGNNNSRYIKRIKNEKI